MQSKTPRTRPNILMEERSDRASGWSQTIQSLTLDFMTEFVSVEAKYISIIASNQKHLMSSEIPNFDMICTVGYQFINISPNFRTFSRSRTVDNKIGCSWEGLSEISWDDNMDFVS